MQLLSFRPLLTHAAQHRHRLATVQGQQGLGTGKNGIRTGIVGFVQQPAAILQGVQPPALSPEAIAAMQSYDWPGNVRQLRNVVERTIILAPRERLGRIDADMLPSEIVSTRLGGDTSTSALMGVPLREARENFEREYLKVQIRRFSGNISKTASFIGMERSALHRKLKLLGMAERREDEDVD